MKGVARMSIGAGASPRSSEERGNITSRRNPCEVTASKNRQAHAELTHVSPIVSGENSFPFEVAKH